MPSLMRPSFHFEDKTFESFTLDPIVMGQIMDCCHAPDLLSMYIFYYGYARDQKNIYVKISLDDLAEAMDWEISRILKIEKKLIRLGILTRVEQGSMKNYVRVDFDWTEIKGDVVSTYFCPSHRVWGADLGEYDVCSTCTFHIKCARICEELEGHEGLVQRDVLTTDSSNNGF